MKFITLLVLLALSYGTDGQTLYYDLGNGIRQGGTEILPDDSNNRQLCNDGENTYYTDGAEIRQVGDSTSTLIMTAAAAIDSLSCACNILAFTYQSDGSSFLEYRDRTDSDVFIMVDLGAGVGRTTVRVDRGTGKVTVVSGRRFWVYELNLLNENVMTAEITLPNEPRCIASYGDGTDLNIFVSFDWVSELVVIFYDGVTWIVEQRNVQRPSGFNARVACLDIDADTIYFLQSSSGDTDWEINSYAVTDWVDDNVDYLAAGLMFSGSDDALDDNVNGLDVCGDACQAVCDPTCDCDDNLNPNCGFCVDGEQTCQCENSLMEECVYPDTSLSDSCIVPEPHLDSYCIVYQPLAQRRRGDPIRIVGAAIAESNIVVSRLAQTGRWNTDTLPSSTQFSGNPGPVRFDGFSADVPSSGRGRRFGVYVAEISPTDPDLNSVTIPCIATENSGFYNRFYTYTRSTDGSVTLVATFNDRLQDFEASVRWLFTGFDSGSPLDEAPVPLCDGNLRCTLNNLDVSDEGVYQVYRRNLNRQKRTWHPIFYLFVRACVDGMFGPSCAQACPACEYGICDELSGFCTCRPGWTGELCDEACNLGFVGQSCGIECTDIFPESTNCNRLSFCAPGKVGCSCYTGLQPAECLNECEGDSCGPNCEHTCEDPDDCDPRTCGPMT